MVFCNFVAALEKFQHVLSEKGILSQLLDGALSINQRLDAIHAFDRPYGPKVLLCSTKCAGVGLNLVAGSRVLLLDLWWNMAVET